MSKMSAVMHGQLKEKKKKTAEGVRQEVTKVFLLVVVITLVLILMLSD